jgi:hypothetical protein
MLQIQLLLLVLTKIISQYTHSILIKYQKYTCSLLIVIYFQVIYKKNEIHN